MIFGLNLSLVITFATVHCALHLVFQRMTQVLTVLVISHMWLNLKGSHPPAQEEDESCNEVIGSLTKRSQVHQTSVSFDAWVVGQKTMSSIIGNLGNDLVPLNSSSNS